jgi:hypothetical protein
MKKAKWILVLILSLAVITESQAESQAGNDDILKVDVRKSFSSKKELILQDFMDVEYIALETNDNFINQGVVLDIGKEIILVRNRINDGDIFVYNRAGKALRKINRKGQGGEEYISIYNITLDEENGELFVNDTMKRKIIVYDLWGKYKRSFSHKKDAGSVHYTEIFNYDGDNLICYDIFNQDIAFILVSKQDGSITNEIKIPFKEKKLLMKFSGSNAVAGGPDVSIIPFRGNWILSEISSDTLYTFLPDYSLRPFIVKTPSVQSMNPEVMLQLRLISDRYIFMETIENVYDFKTESGFPKRYFMYDRQGKTFGGYTVYNGEYSTKKEIYMSAFRKLINHEIESWLRLESHELVESYRKGELKGKLKEIAATLNEEDNPVIMLISPVRER